MCKFYFLVLICLLFSCSGKREKATPAEIQDAVAPCAPDSFSVAAKPWNDVASFIAGRSLPADNVFYSFTATDEWKAYNLRMDSLWSDFFGKTGNINLWQLENLPAGTAPDTVFYPFSGPDILYLTLFYPDASMYYLLAMEPPGTVLPNPEWSPDGEMREAYNLYYNAVWGVLSSSFFRTNDMEKEFSHPLMNGVLPVLLMFLNRTEFEILSVSPGKLDDEGNFMIDSTLVHAVEINFRKRGTKVIKRLCYYSCNLSNRGIRDDKPLQGLLAKRDFAVLAKAASYLMHNAGFWRVKNAFLTRSALIIQDDSGIPFSEFSSSTWNVNLYGEYCKPIPLFRRYFQRELADAYLDTLLIKPMDFRIGYGTCYNLLIAKRK